MSKLNTEGWEAFLKVITAYGQYAFQTIFDYTVTAVVGIIIMPKLIFSVHENI